MNEYLGAALKDAREQHNLDQHELATLLGMSKSCICKIECGKRHLPTTAFLTLGLLFPNWFELRIEELVTDLKADLSTRLRQYLGTVAFGPLDYAKRDWLQGRLAELDGETTIVA